MGEPTEVLVNKAYLPVLSDESRFKVLYGGAGSGKSHFVAQSVVLRCLKEKGRRFLIVRKVARTLRYSVFVLIREIIATMGLENVFEVNRTDMTITCRLNGNQLLFLGLDDVEKLKSIHGITDIWIEEASEVLQSDFEQLNLRLRGNPEIKKQVVLTFNPISATHWLKQYFFDRRRTTHSFSRLLTKITPSLMMSTLRSWKALKTGIIPIIRFTRWANGVYLVI